MHWIKRIMWVCLLAGLSFLLADQIWRLPDPQRMESVIVLAEDGMPLRAFADDTGVWRFPVTIEQVSPLYLDALLTYEDRWFYWHFGVNPLALIRALGQWLLYGEVISGGSTLTMQVARILEPHSRTLRGKLWQMFRALQLEWHYSKQEILTVYLNLAPFGGPIEGVQTASYAYLHKPVSDLSHAEAALLAVLPQSPSRLRPDREPKRAQRYRDKVLKRLQTLKVWSPLIVQEALMEEVVQASFQQPLMAPLFARRMAAIAREQQRASLTTTLNSDMQWSVENILLSRQATLPEQSSAAVLIMENATGYVRAYAGSVDFTNDQRFGHVDMVTGLRSPGSTLKPFLYAYGLDDGLIHSASLLSDVPLQRQAYTPDNFLRGFQGPVTVTEALQRSLNVPAVTLLQFITPESLQARLLQGGIRLQLPNETEANLSIILGGAGTRLEELVRGYSAFARQGRSIALRFTPDDPVIERYMMSAGAAWITDRILQDIAPPNGGLNHLNIAWKTGTSYGFRDAWAIGNNGEYTVGVWTGRPDGTALAGQYGAKVAGPILFDVFRALPKKRSLPRAAQPSSVQRIPICWPTGTAEANTSATLCRQKQPAWILHQTVPPTLMNRQYPSWSASVKQYWLNPETSKRVDVHCSPKKRVAQQVANWPTEVHPWLSVADVAAMRLPEWDDSCATTTHMEHESGELAIEKLQTGMQFYLPKYSQAEAITLELSASGAQGGVTWLVNNKVVGRQLTQHLYYPLTKAGQYTIMALDSRGAVDKVEVVVLDR